MDNINDDIKKQILLQVESGKCFVSGKAFSACQKERFIILTYA